jgi:hypothetical protein
MILKLPVKSLLYTASLFLVLLSPSVLGADAQPEADKPLEETKLEADKPLEETKLEADKPLEETKLEADKPLVETKSEADIALKEAKTKAEEAFNEARNEDTTSSYEDALKKYNEYTTLLNNAEKNPENNESRQLNLNEELANNEAKIKTIQSTLFEKQQETNSIIDNQTCILTLGEICLASGIGISADVRGENHGEVDLRLVGILYNPSLGPDQSTGWHVYLSPAEDFIDAFGLGASKRWFRYKDNKYTVMHLGVHVLVNNEENSNDWRVHYIVSW